MQRRAAAVYVALFLVVGAASFSLIATATEPELSFENPEHQLQKNDTFTANGTEFTVTEISASMEGGGDGGHGGGGQAHLVRSGTLEYTNESAIHTVEWANESNVTWQNSSWTVEVAPGNNSTTFTLREQVDRTAILENDSSVANQTTTVDGVTYVIRTNESGGRELVPAGEYFPAPETREFAEGDRLEDIENHTATVSSVSESGVTLTYTAPETVEVDVEDQANVTVASETYFAHFPDNSTLVLTQDFETFKQYEEQAEQQTEMINGLWGVTIVSGMTAFFLTGLAYLPSRY